MNPISTADLNALAGRPGTLSRAELLDALGKLRSNALAQQFLISFVLAAETHPEEMRQALAVVFDLSAVESSTKWITGQMQDAYRCAAEARELLYQLHLEIDQVELRMETMNFEMENLAAQMAAVERPVILKIAESL